MALVPAQCSFCGAVLTIDSDRDVAVCDSCGNAFLVENAINNYNTYNTINAGTVLVQGADAEQFLKNGTTYIQLGDYNKALGYYEKMIEHFPDNSQGWWGLIRCHTQDFRVCYSNYEDILKWFKYSLKLTNDESYKQAMFNTYKTYLRMQAERDANEEIRTLNELYSVNCSNISELESKISEIEKIRVTRQEEREKLEKDLVEKKNAKETDAGFIKGTAIATVIAIIIAIILFANYKIFWGLIVGFFGFGLLMCTFGVSTDSSTKLGGNNTSQKTHDNLISGAEQRLASFDQMMKEQRAKEDMEYTNLENTIAFHRTEIQKIEESKLLSFEERIEHHFQKRINEVGII